MSQPTPILVLGGTGQVGHELVRELAALGTVAAPARSELDLASPVDTRSFVRQMRPAIVVNAAAYTAVDRAETEQAECAALNTHMPALLAEECKRLNALLVSFSTDYVFDGAKREPYVETDEPHSLGVYGRTKLEGERAVASAGGAFLMLRTAWVYGRRGKNFPLTIMRLARERAELTVVNDQVGSPTSASAVAAGVAQVLRALTREPDFRAASEAASGIYHMTAGGSTTWYEFARTILADDPASAEHVCRTIRPISTAEYPTPAPRPAYSVLDNTKLHTRFGVRLAPWRDQWNARRQAPSVSDSDSRLI